MHKINLDMPLVKQQSAKLPGALWSMKVDDKYKMHIHDSFGEECRSEPIHRE